MISQEQNQACFIVGHEALKNADWKEYAEYCLNREKGLRKKAEDHISYLNESERKEKITQWLEEEKQLLLDWIEFKTEDANDFDLWCQLKGRFYTWIQAIYFEK